MKSGRPNLFQRTMLSWDESIPYNAVHAIRVESQFRPDVLREAIRDTLGCCGYPVDAEGVLLEEREREDQGAWDIILQEVIEAQLARRFDPASEAPPFRFFVIRLGPESFVFGLCYFHPVAGADSILWFLEDVISRYVGRPQTDSLEWHREAPPRYRSLLWRHWLDIPGWLGSMPGYIRRTRCYARKEIKHRAETALETHSLRLDPAEVAWIQAKMREHGSSFHEVILTVVIVSLAKMMPRRLQHPRRREIAVGSIINIRKEFGERAANAFGLFLSSFFVSHEVPGGTDFDAVLNDIQRQTRNIMTRRLHLRNLVVLEAYLLFKKMFTPERYKKMFLRGFPLLASVTGFFVDRFQRHLANLPVSDYWRAVSPSLATPLVLSVTSFRGATNVTVSFNRSIYEAEEVRALEHLIRECLAPRQKQGAFALAG